MTEKSRIFAISLQLFCFVPGALSSADDSFHKNVEPGRILSADIIRTRPDNFLDLSGPTIPNYVPVNDEYRGIDIISNSPGLQVGLTTFDLQAFGRSERQVEWRTTQIVHFVWAKQLDSVYPGARGSGYQAWDPYIGDFVFHGTGGGCDIHPASLSNTSGYPCLDIDTEGKAVISNQHNDGLGLAATLWYDFNPCGCYFAAYKQRLPDTTMQYGCSTEDIEDDFWHFVIPSVAYQVYDGDTVTHVFAIQAYGNKVAAKKHNIHYFRRVGSDTLGDWDYPPLIIDTVSVSAYTVTASRSTGKVALVWLANPGSYPGDPESADRFERDDEGLGWSARTNDVYYMLSNDMGAGWGPKINLTAYDSSQGGWLAGCDVSALIDSDDYLHIVWNSRETVPLEGWLGEWTNFFGSRLYHWDEYNNEIRLIKDANWPITHPSSLCLGGTTNYQWVVRPMLSECEGKFYVVFVQFHDIPHGLVDDCAEARFTGNGDPYHTANGEIYITVSDNGGYNWDIARDLTNTVTPHCYPDESQGTPVCEADQYPSMPRFGMQVTDPTGFEDAIIVDPSNGEYGGNYYLDIMYINDKYPGAVIWADGVWTLNPIKWFRLPCVDPVPNPILSYYPDSLAMPIWTKPGIQLDTTIRLENFGNDELHISSVQCLQLSGPPGWLAVSNSGPINISHLSPNDYTLYVYLNAGGAVAEGPAVLGGYVEISSDSEGGKVDSIYVEVVVADTLMLPETAEIRTECIRLIFNNAGNLGGYGGPDDEGGFNMNFFDDCDTTLGEYDDNARIYLFDGSPFIALIKGNDTILNYSIHSADWLSEDGFRPIESLLSDSTSFPEYRYGYSGKFYSHDSLIAVECEYFAPRDADTCNFIISRQRFYVNADTTIDSVYIGDFLDWDIPSDSGVENGSGYEIGEKLIYCYGAEYGPDDIANNDCVHANQRYGGVAYIRGLRNPYTGAEDSFPNPKAMWTDMRADFYSGDQGSIPGRMYKKFQEMNGYYAWQSTNPTMEDSLYQDLLTFVVFGQYDLSPGENLEFIKILAAEYDGGLTGLVNTINKARIWVEGHLRLTGRCCFGETASPDCDDILWADCAAKANLISWDPDLDCSSNPCMACDCMPGDADGNEVYNMLDILYLVAYLYKGGAAPTPYESCSGDADCNCSRNMLDILYQISYLYKGGPVPCTCEDWLSACGPPLRTGE